MIKFYRNEVKAKAYAKWEQFLKDCCCDLDQGCEGRQDCTTVGGSYVHLKTWTEVVTYSTWIHLIPSMKTTWNKYNLSTIINLGEKHEPYN